MWTDFLPHMGCCWPEASAVWGLHTRQLFPLAIDTSNEGVSFLLTPELGFLYVLGFLSPENNIKWVKCDNNKTNIYIAFWHLQCTVSCVLFELHNTRCPGMPFSQWETGQQPLEGVGLGVGWEDRLIWWSNLWEPHRLGAGKIWGSTHGCDTY